MKTKIFHRNGYDKIRNVRKHVNYHNGISNTKLALAYLVNFPEIIASTCMTIKRSLLCCNSYQAIAHLNDYQGSIHG